MSNALNLIITARALAGESVIGNTDALTTEFEPEDYAGID